MENQQPDNSLLADLLQSLIEEVAQLKKSMASQPTPQTYPDLQPTLKKIAESLSGLQNQFNQWNKLITTPIPQPTAIVPQLVPQPTPKFDTSPIEAELRAIRQELRQQPSHTMKRGVQIGTMMLGLALLSLGILSYFAFSWKGERDAFEVSDWKWRGAQQEIPEYATKRDNNSWQDDSVGIANRKWVVDQEQADATRLAAQKAAEQAAAMNAQADKLEGRQK
jgi:hypothetical protein